MHVNVSSSKISDLLQCSYSFYLKHVLMMPDVPHWKTLVGSYVHNVVEYTLKRTLKRRKLLRRILRDGFTFDAFPNIRRYGAMFKAKHRLDLWEYPVVEAMLTLTFSTLKPYLKEGRFKSEQRFEMKYDKVTVSGYVDILSRGKDKRILDMKTKGKRFTKAELGDNVQAAIYQWWYYETYGDLVPVDFIMVRFPPTKRSPTYHLQTVEAPTVQQLGGLKQYAIHLHKLMNNFTLRDATGGFCSDFGFCERVCPFKRPFDYLSLKDKSTGALIGNYMLDNPPHVGENQMIERLHCKGCPRFN